MASLPRQYGTFVDGAGARWGATARVVGEGSDAIPVGFTFTSQRGERRVLDGSTPDYLSWEQFSDADWCELLAVSRSARAPMPRMARPHYVADRRARLR